MFGEMVVVEDWTKTKLKLKKRRKMCVWLGYTKNHAAGTYHVINLKTNQISLTHNVAFLQRSYGEYMNINTKVPVKKNQELMLIMTDDKDDVDDNNPQLVRIIRL